MIAFLLFLLLSSFTLAHAPISAINAGFPTGTLVTTPQGAKLIEMLQVGDNDWDHFFNNKKHDHGFNGKDPKHMWELAQMIALAALDRDEIKQGMPYRVSGATPHGTMEVKGILLEAVLHISTMYLKKGRG